MKETKSRILLFSSAGVALAAVALIGLNFILSPVRLQLDFTADKLHTLSPGTLAILKKVDAPVQVRFYVSQGKNQMPPELKSYEQQVEDLLAEFRNHSGGNLEIKKFDPEPDSEAEDSAKLDGVEPTPLRNGEQLYMGVAVEYPPQKSVIPFLSPQRERLLEYDLARAVAEVLSTNKPVIGVMSPLQVMGGFNPMAMQMGGRGQTPPWIFVNELKKDFDVQSVSMDSETIDDKFKVILVIHPKDISDKAQFALDQFILRGGKVVAFLDALCLADNRNPNQMGLNLGGGSTMPKLLKAWGLEFDTSKVVADLQFMRQLQGRNGQPQLVPSFLFLNSEGANKDDAVTAQVDDLWIPFAGAFTGKVVDGLKEDVLLKTTKDSELVDGVTAQVNGPKIVDDFKASGVSYALGVRLTGKFKTAFPDGKPGETNAAANASLLKESKGQGAVYLIGDADFVYDPYCVQEDQLFHIAQPRNGNLGFVENLIEEAAGDSNLMGSRSRASVRRNFTVVKKMETEARTRYQAKIEALNKREQEVQTKLSELQVKREGNVSKVILTPEQEQALKQFNTELAQTKRDLRVQRRNLRQDVDALENRLRWVNIAALPVLVSIAGVGLAVSRRRRTAAK
jgi:ABC-type uncharacterized transport system involved in gliding motility auxiliary subunit